MPFAQSAVNPNGVAASAQYPLYSQRAAVGATALRVVPPVIKTANPPPMYNNLSPDLQRYVDILTSVYRISVDEACSAAAQVDRRNPTFTVGLLRIRGTNLLRPETYTVWSEIANAPGTQGGRISIQGVSGNIKGEEPRDNVIFDLPTLNPFGDDHRHLVPVQGRHLYVCVLGWAADAARARAIRIVPPCWRYACHKLPADCPRLTMNSTDYHVRQLLNKYNVDEWGLGAGNLFEVTACNPGAKTMTLRQVYPAEGTGLVDVSDYAITVEQNSWLYRIVAAH